MIALCAIGSSHHRLDFLIGEGKALDPRRCRIFAIDAIGNGLSSSPSISLTQSRLGFPRFSIRDMVASQKLLMDDLGIASVDLVVGASMGGMQALQWAVSFPETVRNVVALTPMAKTTAWSGAMNHAARLALQSRAVDPREDPELARRWEGWSLILQLICARTPTHFNAELAGTERVSEWIASRTRQWIEHGFDPLDWIFQSWAYDAHDVGGSPGFSGDTDAALRSIRARSLIAAPPLDLYNPAEAARWAAERIPACEFVEVRSNAGHMTASALDANAAFELNCHIGEFMRTAFD